ncbi:MAG: GNAT family N-acetyltransferase [Verrucomicrobia bacterium]|nr:GNAT family N-acetyltransferase [Verrucomicrobiota bacterium]
MPAPRPIRRVLEKIANARSEHEERHRPSGFGFALAEQIDCLDAERWDRVTREAGFFLSRRWLRTLESAGPDNLSPRYALVLRGTEPVAAVVMQVVEVSGDRLLQQTGAIGEGKTKTRFSVRRALRPALEKVSRQLRERLLICGNLLSWGLHGVAFAPGENAAELWPAVTEALYRVRRAERLNGTADFLLVKDIPPAHLGSARTLQRFHYRPLETMPNMVLEFRPAWRSYEDYLASLDAKYRKSAQQIARKVGEAGGVVERLTAGEIAAEAGRLHELYLQVHAHSAVRLCTLPPTLLPALAQTAGDDFSCVAVRRGREIVGFVTILRDGETAVGWYMGFDRAAAAEMPLYVRLLHAVIAESLRLGCRRLSLGRTALEPKARLGARPEPLQVWLRHRVPALGQLLGSVLAAVPQEEAPERNPFKEERSVTE